MNFAPYQSSPPESTRAASPPPPPQAPQAPFLPRSQTTSPRPQQYTAPAITRAKSSVEDPWAAARAGRPQSPALPSPSAFASQNYEDLEGGGGGGQQQQRQMSFWGRGGGGGGARVQRREFSGEENDGAYVFETSLGIRMDVEAALAYALVPPVGGVALLLFERKSDYVRFHAYQSALVFGAALLLHLIVSASRSLSWILFVGDVVLALYMVARAYRDAETLDRLELPFFGQLASRFVDRE